MGAQEGWYQADQYKNPANPAAHYHTTGPELWRQTEGQITHFVASLGTCGTITGTGRFLKEKSSNIKVHGVHPTAVHDIPGVRSIPQLRLTEHYQRDSYDELCEVTNQEAFDMCYRLNHEESITAGPSSGMNLVGALRLIPDEPGVVCVVMFCDSVFKYATTITKYCPDVFPDAGPTLDPAEVKAMQRIMERANKNKTQNLSGPKGQEFIAKRNPVIVDVRPAEEFAERLRIPGAINIPLSVLNGEEGGSLRQVIDAPGAVQAVQARVSDASVAERVAQLSDISEPVFVYCNRGIDSQLAKMLLQADGFECVRNLEGGMFEWVQSGQQTDDNRGSSRNMPNGKDDAEKALLAQLGFDEDGFPE